MIKWLYRRDPAPSRGQWFVIMVVGLLFQTIILWFLWSSVSNYAFWFAALLIYGNGAIVSWQLRPEDDNDKE